MNLSHFSYSKIYLGKELTRTIRDSPLDK